jgi:hypothetical protein
LLHHSVSRSLSNPLIESAYGCTILARSGWTEKLRRRPRCSRCASTWRSYWHVKPIPGGSRSGTTPPMRQFERIQFRLLALDHAAARFGGAAGRQAEDFEEHLRRDLRGVRRRIILRSDFHNIAPDNVQSGKAPQNPSACADVRPPTSGVPVPGAKAGSSESTSKLI